MLLGYARISKTDGSQVLDLQRDALIEAAVKPDHIYEDQASGKRDDRPGLAACLKALREGDVLVVWKLDRLGRDLRHLVNTVQDLCDRGVGLRVLTGQGAQLDTTTASGRLVFGIFAALAEFERELIRERTMAGLKAARARGRWSDVRPQQGAGAPRPGSDGQPGYQRRCTLPGAGCHPGYPLPLCGPHWRAPRARTKGAGRMNALSKAAPMSLHELDEFFRACRKVLAFTVR